ncbi:MAG TPA: hypothetical protein PKL83_00810 [bacterium]|nr:hypothetical protein [bacterium]
MPLHLTDLMNTPDPVLAYNVLRALKKDTAESKKRLLADERIQALVQELQDWPGPQLSSHKSASQFFHKLVFLADIGLRHDDRGMKHIISTILKSADDQGIPCIGMNIGTAYGGTGKDTKAWALCDAPNVLYALKRFGVSDTRLNKATTHLAGLHQDNGFGCRVSPALGTWHGPGRKADPCPYATLIMLKLLLLDKKKYQEEIKLSTACLLDLWENSKTRHPYIFYMGTDFRKLKLPFIWYDILHVVDVLSQIPACVQDRRLLDMYAVIKTKETAQGYTPESVYLPWRAWDFGQKKQPSDWMTFIISRIKQRLQIRKP